MYSLRRAPERCMCGADDCRWCHPIRQRCSCQDDYGDFVVEGYCEDCDTYRGVCVDCEEPPLTESVFVGVDDEPRCDRHDELFTMFDEPRLLLQAWLFKLWGGPRP